MSEQDLTLTHHELAQLGLMGDHDLVQPGGRSKWSPGDYVELVDMFSGDVCLAYWENGNTQDDMCYKVCRKNADGAVECRYVKENEIIRCISKFL